VAFAHEHGVIHRDLKPANVMVGRFGEVQVMDWGLAKVLTRAGATSPADTLPASVVRTARGDDEQSQAGTVVGTPAYMAPEQARGQVEKLDERCDVFGLGAILCEILTGSPPFARGEVSVLIRRAARGEVGEALARLDGCGADAELVALARACLAAEAADRPRDAGEVAARVTAYRTGVEQRLRQAEVERAAAQARAEEARAKAVAERRARRLTLGFVAAVLALVVVSAAGGLWAQRVAAERHEAAARQRQAVEAALEKLPGLLKQWRWKEAETVLGEVDRRLGEAGPADLRERAARARADLDLAVLLDTIRLRRATLTVEGKFDNKSTERHYAAAFGDLGVVPGQEDESETAARVRDSGVREQLVAALDEWALLTRDQTRRAWLLGVARRADPDDWRDRIRDAKIWGDRAALEGLADELLRDEAKLKAQSPLLLAALGDALRQQRGDAVPLLAAARRHYPSDFWLNVSLGYALNHAQKWEEAAGYYRAASAVRPETAAVYYDLGLTLKDKGQLDEAIQEWRKASDLDPKFAAAHVCLGTALRDKKRLDEAIREHRKAIDLDPKDAWAHTGLGFALRDKGRLDEAIQEYQKAIGLDRKHAEAHGGLAEALHHKKQLDEAIQEYRTAIELDGKWALAHYNLGRALKDKGRLDEAIQAYRKAIDLDGKWALAHFALGTALYGKRQLDEAIQEYQKAIELDDKLALAHNNLGTALRDKGLLDEAIREYRKAIDLDSKYALPHDGLAEVLYHKKQLDEAIQEYQKAIDLDHKDVMAHYNLGNALRDKGRLNEAIREYQKAIDLDPKYALAHGALGLALLEQGRFAEARRATGRALELLPEKSPLRAFATQQLQRCEQLRALDEKLPAFLEGKQKPDEAERVAVAWLCQQPYKRLYAASARFYAEAFDAKRELASDPGNGHCYNAACSAALAAAGKGDDAPKDDNDRAALRAYALGWLRADLAAWKKLLDGGNPQARATVQAKMKHWRADADLLGVRHPWALLRLPADERRPWQKLWADVAALRVRADGDR
jgi:tetratricopeptide (TPR) repeat protein